MVMTGGAPALTTVALDGVGRAAATYEFRIWGLGFRVSGLKFYGFGIGVGFRIQGSMFGFRI